MEVNIDNRKRKNAPNIERMSENYFIIREKERRRERKTYNIEN